MLLRTAIVAATLVLHSSNGMEAPGAPPGELVDVAGWLEGHWIGEGLGGLNEAWWSPPRAGAIFGAFRHVEDGKVVFYEIITLAPEDGVLVMKLKHFDADLRGWEEPTRSVRFPLLRVEEDALYFDGITYERLGPDRRRVTVMLGPDEDHLTREVFTYSRVGS